MAARRALVVALIAVIASGMPHPARADGPTPQFDPFPDDERFAAARTELRELRSRLQDHIQKLYALSGDTNTPEAKILARELEPLSYGLKTVDWLLQLQHNMRDPFDQREVWVIRNDRVYLLAAECRDQLERVKTIWKRPPTKLSFSAERDSLEQTLNRLCPSLERAAQ